MMADRGTVGQAAAETTPRLVGSAGTKTAQNRTEGTSMSDSNSTTAQMTADTPTVVISAKPVVLPAPGRGEDLQVRVSAPATGSDLPVIVFSHGFGWSMNGYAPLADHWAAHGFVVVQPTHLDSRTLGLSAEDTRTRGSGAFTSRT